MIDILEAYPLSEVLIILIAAALAAHAIFQWYLNSKKATNELAIAKSEELKIPDRIKKLEDENMVQQKQIDLLLESDRNRIKMELLKQCQYFQRKGHIDIRSWECLHQMFDIYKKEGGNSWAEEVLNEIDAIPKETIV